MRNIKVFVIGMMMVALFSLAVSAAEQKQAVKTIYTPSTKTVEYSDGSGNAILYSGMRFADSKGTLLEDAKSLKDCEFCDRIKLVIEEDGTHKVNVLDYDYDSIIIELSYDKDNLQEYVSEVKNKKMKSKIKIKEGNETTEQEIEIGEGSKVVKSLPFGFGKELHFGEESTTVSLLILNKSFVLDDAYTYHYYPNNNYGSSSYLRVNLRLTYLYQSLIKWNIEDIPDNSIITKSDLLLYVNYNELDNVTDGLYVQSHQADNGWTEGSVTENNMPDFNSTFSDRILFTGGPNEIDDQYIGWNITKIIKNCIKSGDECSIILKGNESFGFIAADSHISFYSKDSPYNFGPLLNITYESSFNFVITSPTQNNSQSVNDSLNLELNITSNYAPVSSGVDLLTVKIDNNECSILNMTVDEVAGYLIDFETFTSSLGDWTTSYFSDPGCVWTQDTDGTGSSSTGPCSGASNCVTNDAGYDDNHYVYVETSGSHCNLGTGHAYLDYENVDFDTYPNTNITFAYNMYGATIGQLNVQIDDGSGGWDTIWSISGNQGTSWHVKNVGFSGYSGNRTIRFDYYRNGQTSHTGDIALDVLNISQRGSSSTTIPQFSFNSNDKLWHANCSVPYFESGLKDLFVNISYDGNTYNTTQPNAVNYGGADTTPPTFTTSPYNKTTTNESVEISWTTNENANYTLTIGECPSYTGTASYSDPSSTTTQSQWIYNLNPSTNYCVNVTAADSSNNIASDDTTFNTPVSSDVAAPVISNLRNTSTTNESSYVEWNCNENCNYTVKWYSNPARTDGYLLGTINYNSFTTSHNPLLTDLSNSTTYYIKVIVSDTSGNFATDDTFSFTTAANAEEEYATELEGDDAIQAAIESSEIWIATVYDNYQLSGANMTNQFIGRFDKVAFKGYQRWAINYVSDGESEITGEFSIPPTLNVLELTELTAEQITDQVGDFINSSYP